MALESKSSLSPHDSFSPFPNLIVLFLINREFLVCQHSDDYFILQLFRVHQGCLLYHDGVIPLPFHHLHRCSKTILPSILGVAVRNDLYD